jgi:nicotinamidase-related amidase
MWTRPDPHTLDPLTTAVLVFDMLEAYRPEIEESGALPRAVELLTLARATGMLVAFARADHRADGADFTRVVADVDRWFEPWTTDRPQPSTPAGGAALDYRSLAELGQGEADIDILKHRWSAFHGTALDLTLRVQGIDTVLVIGGSTHVGVASTVYAGRDLDYQMIVVRDATTGHQEPRDYFNDVVFPRMCRVRTVDEVREMLGRQEAEVSRDRA